MNTAGTQQKSDLIRRIEEDTLEALMGTQANPKAAVEVDEKLAELGNEMEEALKIRSEKLRGVRIAIINASLATLGQAVENEERDLSTAMVGLRELMERIGISFKDLTEPSLEEKQIIGRAEAAVRNAEAGLANAQGVWFFRRSRIASAQETVTAAKTGLASAKAKAEQFARSRLMHARIDDSLQNYTTLVSKIIQIMMERKQQIDLQLTKVSERRIATVRLKEQALAKVEQLDEQLEQLEEKYKTASQELDGLVKGSAEYVKKEAEVLDLRNKVETLNGERNTALAIYQSKERFCEELQVHESAQRKLSTNQAIWIATLRSDTQERLVTFASRLEAMKAVSDQNVARNLDQVGVEIDARNIEVMAQVGTVSDKVRQEMFEQHPDRMARILNAAGAQQEAIAEMRVREKRAMEMFRSRYGVEPTAEAIFSQ